MESSSTHFFKKSKRQLVARAFLTNLKQRFNTQHDQGDHFKYFVTRFDLLATVMSLSKDSTNNYLCVLLVNFRIVDKKVMDEPCFLLIQKLLLSFGFDTSAKICTGRVSEQYSCKKGGHDFRVDPVLRREPNDLSREGHYVVENVTMVSGKQLTYDLKVVRA